MSSATIARYAATSSDRRAAMIARATQTASHNSCRAPRAVTGQVWSGVPGTRPADRSRKQALHALGMRLAVTPEAHGAVTPLVATSRMTRTAVVRDAPMWSAAAVVRGCLAVAP